MLAESVSVTIGALAKAAGVSVETVRYYQRRALFPTPPKSRHGFRRYGPEALERLRGIKRAQRAGFTLTEIAVLLRLDRVRDRRTARDVAVQKIAQIDEQIAVLQALRTALSNLTRKCEKGAADLPCPILEAIRGADAAARQVKRS